MVKKVTEKEFKNELNGIVLVDFYADWCGPCKMVSPIIEELSNTMKNVGFAKVNVDEEMNLASTYGVRSIPTLVLYKDGKEVDRKIGFAPKQDLMKWIEKHQ